MPCFAFSFQANEPFRLSERLLALARQDLRVNQIAQSPEEQLDILDWIQQQREQKDHYHK